MRYPDNRPRPTSPEQFRAVATGTGNCIDDSIVTGTARNLRAQANLPAKQRAAIPQAEGWQLGGPSVTPSADFAESTY